MTKIINLLVASGFVTLTLLGAGHSEAAGLKKKFLLVAPASKIATVTLNPQPLPPKEGAVSRLDMVGLNPQPLPPKVLNIFSGR